MLIAHFALSLQASVNLITANLIKMLQNILISVLIIAIALALLAVKVIVKKDGKFSSFHIEDNEHLKKEGIHCVIDMDRAARRKGKAL